VSKIRKQWLLAASIILWVLSATVPAGASGPPDSTLFTTYIINTGHTSVSWVVCGSTQQSSGCYGSAYKKTDTVSSTFDTVTVTLSKTVSLPLVGGSSALASMAANNKFLFVGTNQSPQAVEIQKGNFAITQIGGFSPPMNVTAITTDKYGYVIVTFGSFGGGENGFVVLGPDQTVSLGRTVVERRSC
jgi:hypothetical protein